MNESLSLKVGNSRLSIASPAMDRRKFVKDMAAASALLGFAPGLLAADEITVPEGKKLKVGVIGCGNVCRGAYLPSLKTASHVDVVSCCDIIPQRAKDLAEKHKVPHYYPNIDEMLAGEPFDLLVNTTSMPSHYPVNKKALEAKRYVWSEKPMAMTVEKGRELLELAKKNNTMLWAAPTCVTSPQFRFMAQAIASGKIGRVTAGHGTYGHGGPTWSGWFYEKGGGSLYDLGVYNVTTLTGLLGPVKEVVGMTEILNPTRKVEDRGEVKVTADENTMLIMNHGNGILSHVQTGFVYFEHEHLPRNGRQLYTLDIMGTQGAMHVQGWDWEPAGVDVATRELTELETQCTDKWPYSWVGGAIYVSKCLLAGKTSLITPEHGLHVLDVMNACHESQETGKRVKVQTTFKWPLFG